jgi:hypothetical protein
MSEKDNIIGKGQKLFFVFLLFLVLFNFPLMSIFNINKLVMGLPLLYLYLFFSWAALIAIMYFLVRGKNNKVRGNE